ncbi:TetR/AcrR family transcriptional regulator [Streptomyces sp. 8L]|uniref:TetR/AcrR family transcriptional regulator n=1 Tax=Streptomyces sp. 8L TaxID=2877242 RepID=UPI0027E0C7A8|nr:helix-turn-helix domain-containing protein [Streptomyces sp. 8L]
MRQDAQRSRERVLAAAREVYAEWGVEAPLDVIARRAGVGNATLYRRFPDRAALIEAVFQDGLAATMEAGEAARAAEDPMAGLTGYLEHVFAGLAVDRGVTDLMTTRLAHVPTLERLHGHNAETLGLLLARCRADGVVREDVSVADVLFALAVLGRGVPAAEAARPGSWRRFLALFLDGLRAGPGADADRDGGALPGTPYDPETLRDALGALHVAASAAPAPRSAATAAPKATPPATDTGPAPADGPTD